MLRRSIQAGGEKWAKYAGRKLAALTKLRVHLNLPRMHRTFFPESGVTVWVQSSRFGDWMKITAGEYEATWGYREVSGHTGSSSFADEFRQGLGPSSDFLIGDTTTTLGESEVEPAEYSKNGKAALSIPAAAYAVEDAFPVGTVPEDITLRHRPGNESVVFAHMMPAAVPAYSFFRRRHGNLSKKGDYAALIWSPGEFDSSLTRIANGAKWLPPVPPSETGAWESFDIPFPTSYFDALGVSVTDLGGGNYQTTIQHGFKPRSFDLGSDPPGAEVSVNWILVPSYVVRDVEWRQTMNPYNSKKLLIEVIASIEGISTSEIHPPFEESFQHYMFGDERWVRYVGEFDLVTRLWTTLSETFETDTYEDAADLVDLGPPTFAFQYQTFYSGGDVPQFDTLIPAFRLNGAFADVHFDNRATPTRLSAVDVTLDGVLWFSNISVDSAAGGPTNALDPRGVTVRHLGTEDRGAITASFAGDGREGTFWKHTDGEWTTTAVEAANLWSKNAEWMARGTDNRLLYKNGTQVFDGAADLMKVWNASYDKDGEFYGEHKSPTAVPESYTVWTGIVDLPGPGFIPCNAGVGRGIYTQPDETDSGGTKVGTWFLAGGVLSFTALASYPVGTVLVITGGSFVLAEPGITENFVFRVKEVESVFSIETTRLIPSGFNDLVTGYTRDNEIHPLSVVAAK